MTDADTKPTARGIEKIEHSRRHKYGLLRFLAIGTASYLVGTGTLFVVHEVLSVNLVIATTIAYLTAFLVNFSGSRSWVFKAEYAIGQQIIKYTILCGLNYILMMAIMGSLIAAHLHYLFAKTGADGVLAGLNYVIYRCWVFRPPSLQRTQFPAASARSRRGPESDGHSTLITHVFTADTGRCLSPLDCR